MGKHREQGHFDRARWRLALLVPFWILQLLFLLGLMTIFSYRLVATSDILKDEQTKADVSTFNIVWEAANVGFSLLSLGLCLLEIAKFVAEALTPLAMFVSHIIKIVFSFTVLGLDIAVHLQDMEGKYPIIGLGIDCGLLLAITVPTIYSILVFRRHLKYSDYQHPVNAKSYGFSTPPKINTSPNDSRLELGDDFYADDSEMSYPSQTTHLGSSRSRSSSKSGGTLVVATRPRSLLSTRSDRRVSSGGSSIIASSILTMLETGNSGGRESLDVAKARAPAASPRETYSHERSTEFDEYVKRRSMVVGSDGSSTLDAPSPGATRCVSWGTSRGLLLPVPEGQEDGGANGAYFAYNPHRNSSVSLVSALSPPGSPPSGPVRLGVATSPYAANGARLDRARSGASDRTGLMMDSNDIGNASMSWKP